MSEIFKKTEWYGEQATVTKLENGQYYVTRNVIKKVYEDGSVRYEGEFAYMSETAYFAYEGAKEVAMKRENEIIDEYTMELIEEGVIS